MLSLAVQVVAFIAFAMQGASAALPNLSLQDLPTCVKKLAD
jgi:hypothetical protein